MALIDWESVVQDTLEHVRSKHSHGQRELTDFIADRIVAHRQPEGLAEKAFRLYTPEVQELIQRSAGASPDGDGANGRADRPIAATR